MGKILDLVAFGIIAFLLVFGSFTAISYSQTTAHFESASLVGLTFAKPSATTAALGSLQTFLTLTSPTFENLAQELVLMVPAVMVQLNFSMSNGGIIPVYIPSETHQLFVNGILVGTGSSPGGWIPAGSTVSFSFLQNVSSGELEAVLRSAFSSGGIAEFTIVGTGQVAFIGIPFTVSGQVNLVAYLSQKLGVSLP